MTNTENKNSIFSNYLYSISYQILILIVPLVSAPYLSRVLGSEGVGIYSYTNSISYYFMIFIVLGLNNYGNRTIAQNRNDNEVLSKKFWDIYYLQLLCGICSTIVFIFLAFVSVSDIHYYLILQFPFILSAILDINWFYFGIEKFRITIIRNSVAKIISLICIFIFVKEKDDLSIYILIMSVSTMLSQLFLWTTLKKFVSFSKFDINRSLSHLKLNLILFVPVIAVSIYKIISKIMIGLFSTKFEVGIFDNADKIINVPVAIITALGTVMLPRISNFVTEKKYNKIYEYIELSIKINMFLASGMTFGIMVISKRFAPLFFGVEFYKTGNIILGLVISVLFISFANVLRTQYLIPFGKDKEYVISVIIGAIVNLVINIILVGRFGGYGAVVGTVFAEMSVCIVQSYFMRNELPINQYVISSVTFIIKGFIAFLLVIPINHLDLHGLVIISLQIIIGTILYFIFNYQFLKDVFVKLRFRR